MILFNLNVFMFFKELYVNGNVLLMLLIDMVEDLDLEVLFVEFNRLSKLYVKLKDLFKLCVLWLFENFIEMLFWLNKIVN